MKSSSKYMLNKYGDINEPCMTPLLALKVYCPSRILVLALNPSRNLISFSSTIPLSLRIWNSLPWYIGLYALEKSTNSINGYLACLDFATCVVVSKYSPPCPFLARNLSGHCIFHLSYAFLACSRTSFSWTWSVVMILLWVLSRLLWVSSITFYFKALAETPISLPFPWSWWNPYPIRVSEPQSLL